MKDRLKAVWGCIVWLYHEIRSVFCDDKGNLSSMRIMLALAAWATWDMILWWRDLVVIEMSRQGERDLEGVALIGGVIIPTIMTAIIAKLLQKKMEDKE